MPKCNKDGALKVAVELTKAALEGANTFVPPEKAIEYLDKIYQYLTVSDEDATRK